MKKVSLVLIFLLPLGFYLVTSYFMTENYYKWADKYYELCLASAKVEINEISINTCSQIRSATDRAFSRATTFYSPIIVLLTAANFALAFALFNLGNRLEKLEKKQMKLEGQNE